MLPPRLLGLSGSLRRDSLHTRMLKAGQIAAASQATFEIGTLWAALPLFNPDLEHEPLPSSVQAWRAQVQEVDGVILCCPEYARGIPGAIKNALDWLVGGAEIYGKVVALWSPQPRSVCVGPALRLVLPTMGAKLCQQAAVTLPLLGKHSTVSGIASDLTQRQALCASVHNLLVFARATLSEEPLSPTPLKQ